MDCFIEIKIKKVIIGSEVKILKFYCLVTGGKV